MIINRHNYEEFFLLYVDDELDVQDRAAVEDFVHQNPDLAEEMEMLKQATFQQENVVFESKEVLYKEAAGISLENYEEYFVLALDGELSARENEEVEKFVLKHPELQNEYLLLEQTRLEPENIKFAGKEILYRKNSNGRRIIFADWMKFSAAASIIGIAIISWLFANNSSPVTGKPIAMAPKEVKRNSETPKQSAAPVIAHPEVAASPEILAQKEDRKKAVSVRTREKNIETSHPLIAARRSDGNKRESRVEKAAQSVTGSLPNASPADVAASTQTTNKNNLPPVHDRPAIAAAASEHIEQADNNIARHAVYREIDNDQDEEEKSFYIGSAEINKNKLKGLFKKAVNLFEKKSNKTDDGEKTLRIAGFERKSK